MSNKTIRNTQESTLDLTPLRDVYDVVLVLRPKGSPGDSREISEETASDDVVGRVKTAGWVTVSGVAAPAAAVPPPAAAALPPPPAPSPAPVAVTAPEPTMEMPKETVDALVEETKPSVEEPPARPSRRSPR